MTTHLTRRGGTLYSNYYYYYLLPVQKSSNDSLFQLERDIYYGTHPADGSVVFMYFGAITSHPRERERERILLAEGVFIL